MPPGGSQTKNQRVTGKHTNPVTKHIAGCLGTGWEGLQRAPGDLGVMEICALLIVVMLSGYMSQNCQIIRFNAQVSAF